MIDVEKLERFVDDLLKAEISEKEARSIKHKRHRARGASAPPSRRTSAVTTAADTKIITTVTGRSNGRPRTDHNAPWP